MRKTIKILILCFITTYGFAQKKLTKTSQSIKVNKDAVVDLNTNYVEIEIDTWNKDVVEVEAYIESEKLSDEELKEALKVWNLKVDGSKDKVIISSNGGKSYHYPNDDRYALLLKNLEYNLADIPELPEINLPELPNMIVLGDMPELPNMPDIPMFPKLPELPEGVTTINFDYERYQSEGEAYLSKWSKKYERKGGKELQKKMEDWARKFAESGYQEKMERWGEEYSKRFEGKWAKDMEKWGEQFGDEYAKDMEEWAEKFSKQFGEEWEAKMEAWGERFEKQMEKQSKELEKQVARSKRLKALKKREAKRSEELVKRSEERRKRLEEKKAALNTRKAAMLSRRYESGSNNKVRKIIKIKIPKKAKLNMNVRHGELKIASEINSIRGDISHSFLVAERINGSNTSINVSYSPVVINNWDLGALNLNFVDKAQIKTVKNVMLVSKSSNVTIEDLSDTAIINGSFGDLTLSKLSESFKNLNLVLENSDALINLPKAIDYNMYFTGNRSKYNNKPTVQKTVRNYPENQTSNRTIIVNAKFSNVIMN